MNELKCRGRKKPSCEMKIGGGHEGLWVVLLCYSSIGCWDPKSYIYMYIYIHTNNLCLVCDPTVTGETRKKPLSFCRLQTKPGVCKSCHLLKCEFPVLWVLGLGMWKGKAARWARKGESLL